MDSIKLSFNTPKPKRLRSVYVVEDNPVQRTMLIDYLSKYENLVVKGFFSGEACIKDVIISKIFPDLVLLDYFLDTAIGSTKDGLDTLTKLKEVSPHTEIIMLTSVDNEQIVSLAKKKGAMAYVVKGEESFDKLDSLIQNNFSFETPPTVED